MTHDDPNLTAYALDELEPADRAEVEALLAKDERARQFVEETRQTAALIAGGLRSITPPTLTAEQRQAIAAASAGAPAATSYRMADHRRPPAWARWALATAASAALVAGGISMLRPHGAGQGNVAQLPATTSSVGDREKAVLALVERSQEAIRNRHYQQALGVLDQILQLDPTNDYARGARPLVYDCYQIQVQRGEVTAAGDRARANVLRGVDENKVRYEDGLQYTGNWPEVNGAGVVTGTTDAGAASRLYANNFGSSVANNLSFSTSLGQSPNTYNFQDGFTPNLGRDSARSITFGVAPTDLGDVIATSDMLSVDAIRPQQKIGGKTVTGSSYAGVTTPDPGQVSLGLPQSGASKHYGLVIGGYQTDKVGTANVNEGQQMAQANGAATLDAKAPVQATPPSATHDFYMKLAPARDAVARGDGEGARAALLLARADFSERAGQFDPHDYAEARVALTQVESAIPGTEAYAAVRENGFQAVTAEPLSTFSIDVDTASYSNVRRFLDQGQLPPPDAVRIEELLNYFPYDYVKPAPESKEPFWAAVEVATCPWDTSHRLARVAIKGREIALDKRPVSNLVFLIDVSGSMNEPRKLPLVKEGLKLMVNELTENDRVAIVVYAGNAGLVLPSTCADPKSKATILAAIDNLSAGGSTNGGQGIELAYRIATENFIKGGTNRVLLATDGDWNVGITDQGSLTNLIEDKAKSGVFLSVLGYGFGNLKDAMMVKLADKGNGHYAYIDNLKEARKVLVEEMSSTLITIAKDVKVQVEFNPAQVQSYRLIGYEKRMLRAEDFNNDKVDAGEIGAGHSVTALYELVPGKATPTTAPSTQPAVDTLKYQKHDIVKSDDLLTLKLRYKQPDGDVSSKIEIPASDKGISYAKASDDFKFAAAVAQFGMVLRNSPHKGTASLAGVIELADEGKGKDAKHYRAEFVELATKADALRRAGVFAPPAAAPVQP